MKKVVSIIISAAFALISLESYSQEIEEYVFRVNAVYLPTIKGQSEYYVKIKNKLSHVAEDNKNKKRKLQKEDIQYALSKLDSLLSLEIYSFEISKELLERIKEPSFFRENFKIKDVDIDNFVQDKKVTLRMEDIKIDIIDYLSGQFDGAHYSFYLEMKRTNGMVTKYNMHCGSGGVSNLELKEWLVLYLFFKEHDLFKTIPSMKSDCFSEEKLINVILRFIKQSKEASLQRGVWRQAGCCLV